ncbi:hypothetical protein PVK06_034378 [Gossypium arboreum]|uniref:GST C-terminal domain-containing protein n=1 Tax=Gossypium arboreum TaxID=29729 RepID=A0ABR0NE22_GOSAR|nr:hypothetical protein PVK06_034378 [Gossypium arboreum]
MKNHLVFNLDLIPHADLFLAPQLHIGINLFNVDLAKFQLLSRVKEAYNELPEFQNGMPENQPDAPST